MKRCLWVVPKGIFPVRDGARVANHALLKSIRPHFNELDLLLFNEEDSDELYMSEYNKTFNPTNVYFFKKPQAVGKMRKLFFLGKSFLQRPELPVTTGYFVTEKLKKEINQVLTRRHYDLVVFDGLHPFTGFKNLAAFQEMNVVYRAHNVEGDLWREAASKTKNAFIKKLLLWQGEKMQELESSLIKRSKKVWCIAPEDLKRFEELNPQEKVKLSLVPVGMEFKKIAEKKKDDDKSPIKLLFLGKMDWAPNRDGLKWFLEDIWPLVNHQHCELHIVGSGDASWGSELFKSDGVKFFGFVNDLDSVYHDCDYSIIPIRYGSGTRIKVIESISKGVPVISTEMGVQGSSLNDYFKADKKEEWVSLLNSLDRAQGQEMASLAFRELEKIYSPKSIGKEAFDSAMN